MISPVVYLKEVGQELRKVEWPHPRIVALHTGIVIVSMIVIVLLVSGIDSLLVTFIQKVLLKG